MIFMILMFHLYTSNSEWINLLPNWSLELLNTLPSLPTFKPTYLLVKVDDEDPGDPDRGQDQADQADKKSKHSDQAVKSAISSDKAETQFQYDQTNMKYIYLKCWH